MMATLLREMKLGDVIRFANGKAIKPGGQGRYPVYGSNGIIGQSDEFRHENGVIIGRVGAYCGIVAYCPGKFWASDNTLVVFPINADFDTQFLFYFLHDAKLSRYAGGAAQPLVTQTVLKQVDVKIPPLHTQRHIATILSAYDDLIENNMRRIKILEEMARALYCEWFVEFRFPGATSPAGALPHGWAVSRLGDHLIALETGTRPKGGVRDEIDGIPSIGAENIDGIGRHKFESEKHVSREFFQQMKRGVVQDRDIAIYKDGAYIGKSSYFRDGFPHSECCVNEHVFLVRPEGVRLSSNALYLWLQTPDTLHAIRATNANAAQPGINQPAVNGLELILPDSETAKKFDTAVEPLLAEIINIAKRNQNLRRTRDLLLPRLLAGQVPPNAQEMPKI